MAKKTVPQSVRSSKLARKSRKNQPFDIVNEFLTMCGRIHFHYGIVTSRKFVSPNTFVEEGFWQADTFSIEDDNNPLYYIPYTLTATMGEPILRDISKEVADTKARKAEADQNRDTPETPASGASDPVRSELRLKEEPHGKLIVMGRRHGR